MLGVSPVAVLAPVTTIVIHPDRAASPVAIVREPIANAETNSKRQPRIWRIIIGPLNINDFWIVPWNIDHVRLSGNDTHIPVLDDDLLLRRVHENAVGACAESVALNRRHHFLRLIQIRGAQLLSPREILIHPLDDVGIMRQRLDTVVPRLAFDLVRTVSGIQETSG